MGSPALKAPVKGIHVLFIIRNPSGITPVLSYLNSRSIKSWTATTLEDATTKISDNQIQIVFLSISLKNVSVATIIEQIKNQFSIPIVIFSEETSRKIEGDMRRLATANKIVPPNQNAKFLEMIQMNVTAQTDTSGEAGAPPVAEDLLPPHSEPIEGEAIPEQGRWLKINTDENATAPFTYKLIQPRSLAIGRTRYFFVGAKIPELSPEGRGWVATDGQFYVYGRIVEMKVEPPPPPNTPKIYQFSPGDVPEPTHDGKHLTSGATVGAGENIVRMPPRPVRSQSFFERLRGRLRYRPDNIFKRWNSRFINLREKVTLALMLDKIRKVASFRSRIKSLRNLVGQMPDPSEMLDLFQQIQPWVSRDPANEIERALVKAAVRTMDPPFKDEPPPSVPATNQVCVAFIRSAELEGFILSDAVNSGAETCGTLANLINTMHDRLNRKLNGVELTLPPTVVNIDPVNLREQAARGSHFVMWADNGAQRLYTIFIPAPGVELPRASSEHDKLEIQAGSIHPDLNLLFDLYLHMPLNDKRLQFRRTGQMVSEALIEKLKDSTDTDILIRPEAEAAFFAYAALAALQKPRAG